MAPGPLSSRVADLCEDVGHRLGGDIQAQVFDVRRRLGEPLRVAIAGRLKAGKSTVVNALIGRRVAPTEVGECTRVVTQFRYGTTARVDVVRKNGTRAGLPLDEAGMIPQKLGVPRHDIAYVDVTLPSDRLRDLTIVDTPGLAASASARCSPVVAAPLDDDLDGDSARALAGAEAIIYVFTQPVHEDDVQALEAFRSMSARLSSNPINSLGLFNKVDKRAGSGADPWPVAESLANDQAKVLRHIVSDVVPIVGLLAETTEAGRLTAADCEALRRLAALPQDERQALLASVDLLRKRDAAVSREARERLLRLLDLYGISFAVHMLVQRPQLATGELVRLLLQASGFTRLRQTLDHAFRWRSDTIKAGWGLSSLEKIASHAGRRQDRELLRDAIERVLQQPEYHQLRVLEVAQLVTTGAVDLPADMQAELTKFAQTTDPRRILNRPDSSNDELIKTALQAARRWHTYATATANPVHASAALRLHRAYLLLARNIRDGH